MQPSPSITPVSGFGLRRLRAVTLAYRTAMGEGLMDGPAHQRAVAAYLHFGGTRGDAMREVPGIIASASAQHGEWFWQPTRERLAREEAALEAACWWPGPVNPEARREMMAQAMAFLEARQQATE
jgi:hypothetical protein